MSHVKIVLIYLLIFFKCSYSAEFQPYLPKVLKTYWVFLSHLFAVCISCGGNNLQQVEQAENYYMLCMNVLSLYWTITALLEAVLLKYSVNQ